MGWWFVEHRHGGAGRGQGRKPLPLFKRKVKKSVTLSLIAIAAVEERRRDGEEFSTALDRILSSLPVLASLPALE